MVPEPLPRVRISEVDVPGRSMAEVVNLADFIRIPEIVLGGVCGCFGLLAVGERDYQARFQNADQVNSKRGHICCEFS